MKISKIYILFIFTMLVPLSAFGDKVVMDFANGKFEISTGWPSLNAAERYFVSRISDKKMEILAKKNISDEEIDEWFKSDYQTLDTKSGHDAYVVFTSAGKGSQIYVFEIIQNHVVGALQDNGKIIGEIKILDKVFREKLETALKDPK